MLVKELAEKYSIEQEVILATLKSLRLRVKGEEQALSAGVLAVLKAELEGKGVIPKEPEPVKAAVKKKVVRKKVVKTSTDDNDEASSLKKNTTKAAVVKKEVPKKQVIVTYKAPPPGPDPLPEPQPEPEVLVTDEVAVLPEAEIRDNGGIKKPSDVTQKDGEGSGSDSKKVVTKVVKKIVKKVVPKKEQPAFVSVKPLNNKRRGADTSRGSQRNRQDQVSVEEKVPEQVVPAKQDGPLIDMAIRVPITVGDLAFQLQQKANVLLKTLMSMGLFANINQNLGEDIVRKLCEQFGYALKEIKSQEERLIEQHEEEKDDPASLKWRAPVVTFMGHVDHGKTSLLDSIRKTKVVDSEHGGITQHIRAYSVKMPKGSITFLDTPGHAAFTAMRARGAHVTDIVVLVVAANEGVKPQTQEAIDHARAAGVPIVVALNKVDRPDVDIDMVKKQLMGLGLTPEDWGGKTVMVPVSAHTGQGLDALLEMILLESEMLELRVNPDKLAAGIVVEAHLSPGKGALATLIVQSGTLRDGDIVIVGPYYGRVKAMFDDHKRLTREAGPSDPVEVLGLSAVPEAGERFMVVKDEKTARDIASVREERMKSERLRVTSKITLEDVFARTDAGRTKELNIVLKADVQGSLQAVADALMKIPAENQEVAIKFIHSAVGSVNASDVILAAVSKAIIITFNVGVSQDAEQETNKTPVEIRRYNVIYDAVNDIKSALEGMLKPDEKRNFLGRAEVRQVFKLSRSGLVAGSYMLKGKMKAKSSVEVVREGQVVHTGTVSALKRFKEDVREVAEGYECGISVSGFDGYQVGDLIESFEIEHIARKL